MNTQQALDPPGKKSLHGADNESVAIHSTLEGKTEDSVVVDILGTGTGGGGAHRSATSEDNSNQQSSKDDSKLFHGFTPL